MVHIIYRYAIQEHQVLVGAATANVEPSRTLGAALYTRKQLQHLQHVGLAKHGWHGLYLCDGDVHGTHLRTSYAEVETVAHDGHLA